MSKIQNFFDQIAYICKHDNVDYMEAVIEYCERNEIDVEDVGKYIKKNPLMLSKIQEEAENLNYIQKSSRLPI